MIPTHNAKKNISFVTIGQLSNNSQDYLMAKIKISGGQCPTKYIGVVSG
jgi:hypothetical protein